MHLRTTTPNGIDVSTIELSTWFVGARGAHDTDTFRWETCIFMPNGDSEVVDTYESEATATAGHAEWVAKATADQITL